MRHSAFTVALVLLCGCTTTALAPIERQRLETRTYPKSYGDTYAACRDAFVNFGYMIEASDYDGGVLVVSSELRLRDPGRALGLSLVLPPAGDIYTRRYNWVLLDLITWPFSILWSAPSNFRHARDEIAEIEGNVVLQDLGQDRTRVRITLAGLERDAGRYPLMVRALQEEVERQLFLHEGDTLGGQPQ